MLKILGRIENVIAECNPFYQIFRSNKEELEEQLVTDPNSCRMWLSRSVVPEINRRPGTTFVVNNYTTAGEVAMIFRDDEGLPPEGMKIAVYPRSGHRQLIDIRDPNTDPMLFPLIYTYGQQGNYSLNFYQLNYFNH